MVKIINDIERIRQNIMLMIPNVGEEVTLTFDATRTPPKKGPLAGILPDTFEVKGKVAVKPRWDKDPDHICVFVANSPCPVRIIDVHEILSINGRPTLRKKGSGRITKMHFKISGSKGMIYDVTFDSRFWSCNCPSFHFRRNCRHISEAKAAMEAGKDPK